MRIINGRDASRMLQEQFAAVLGIDSREQLLRELLAFASSLEFETVCAIAVVDRIGAESEFHWVHNSPPAACAEFEDNYEVGRRDPVKQHCKRSGQPIYWNQDTYVNAGQGELWERLAHLPRKVLQPRRKQSRSRWACCSRTSATRGNSRAEFPR